jgi:hypothetical protein
VTTGSRLRRTDLLWLLALPLYVVVGTARHETCHAVVAAAEGARITRFVVWPSVYEHQFFWGYVVWEGRTDVLVSIAPYLGDLLTFAVFWMVLTRVRFRRHWLWVNLLVLGLVSPLVNSAYEGAVAAFTGAGDVAVAAAALPRFTVAAYMTATVLLYLAGVLSLMIRPRGGCNARADRESPRHGRVFGERGRG